MTTERKTNRTRGYRVNMAFNGNIHEAEYVPIPARVRLPINSTSESSVSTPARIPTPVKSPNLTVANLSRDNSTNVPVDRFPNLIHKWSHTHSILCVVPSPKRNLIFCGTQNSKILVFDIVNYSLKYEIKCGNSDHSASILCLTIDESEDYLFSAGSDSLIKVWDLSMVNDNTNYPIHCTHIIYLLVDIGDVFLYAGLMLYRHYLLEPKMHLSYGVNYIYIPQLFLIVSPQSIECRILDTISFLIQRDRVAQLIICNQNTRF